MLHFTAFDFGFTSSKKFDITIAYNRTYKNDTTNSPPALLRVSRSMNMVIGGFVSLMDNSCSHAFLIPRTNLQNPQVFFA